MKLNIRILIVAMFIAIILGIPNIVQADQVGIFEYSIDSKTNEVIITGVTDRNITEVSIPETIDGKSVCIIGEYAFADCSNLQNVDLGSVKELKSYSFSNCTSLKEIVFPKELLTIGSNTFSGDYNLKKINMYYNDGKMKCSEAFINSGVDTVVIEERYAKIKNLKGINIKNVIFKNIGTIDRECQGMASIENIQIDDSITWISDYSFKNCTGLKSINLPKKASIVGKYLFDGCTSLKKINIPANLKNSPGTSGIFINSYINHIVFDKGLTEIPEKIFADDSGDSITIKTIEYEEGTIEIASIKNFYRYKGSVKNVIIPSTARIISTSAFLGFTLLSNIDISNINVIGQNAFGSCESLETIIIPSEIIELKDKTFNNCINLRSVVMGENIVKIGANVFSNCKNLSKIVLPSKLEKIGIKAFSNCEALKQIIIPFEVTSIEQSAFSGCSNLEKIVINGKILELAGHIFENCEKLTDIYLPSTLLKIGYKSFYNCSNLTSITLPESLTEIGEYAFEKNYSLKQINLPKSIKDISSNTFNIERLHPSFKATVEYGSYAHNYAEKYNLPYQCVKYKISDCKIEGNIGLKVYTGETFTPKVYVKNEKRKEVLIENENYKLAYLNNKNAGIATILITGINNYEGTVEFYFRIEKATYDMTNVKFENITSIYDGKKHSIIATGLPKGVSVVYQNNDKTNAGTYKVTAIFTGDSTNYNTIKNMTATLKINPKNISNSIVSSVKNQKYTGKEIKPSVTVKDENIILKNGTDYIVLYNNNKNTGKATITITGKGNYAGIIKKTFNIVPKATSISSVKNVSKKSAKISWKKDTRATGYEIYMSTAKADKNYMKTTGKLNLRKSTSTSSKSLIKMSSGAKVKILKKNAKKSGGYTWYKVSYKGKTGYVASKYLKGIYKEGTYSKIKTISSNKTTSYTKTKLTKGKRYTYKIRSYKVIDGKKVYGSYSSVKWVTIKK